MLLFLHNLLQTDRIINNPTKQTTLGLVHHLTYAKDMLTMQSHYDVYDRVCSVMHSARRKRVTARETFTYFSHLRVTIWFIKVG